MERNFTVILAEFLKSEGINQKEFAKQVGISTGQVNEWLKGRSKPAYDNLKKIVKAFNVSASVLRKPLL